MEIQELQNNLMIETIKPIINIKKEKIKQLKLSQNLIKSENLITKYTEIAKIDYQIMRIEMELDDICGCFQHEIVW